MPDGDAELVRRYLDGDATAFRELVDRHRDSVYGTCFKLLRNPDEADEVTQLTFVRAFRKLEGFRGQSAFRTWLYRIAVNACRNRVRDEGRRRAEPLEDHAPSAVDRGRSALDEVLASEVQDRVRAAVEDLPEKQRWVLELRLYRDLPYREISKILGCREGTAKVNYHYAIRNLRKRLADLRAEGVA